MLIKRDGEEWREPAVSSFLSETALRDILAASSRLLPKSTGPAVAVKELPVSSGSIDVAAVEPSGQVVLCECKLDANPQSRRTVLGQLLSYAGAACQLDYDEFCERFARKLRRPLVDAMRAIADEEWDEDEFRESLGECLATGNFRLVVVVDAITDELKNAVLYLNRHSAPGIEVLALELGYTRDGDIEILVPTSYGEEVTPPKPPRNTWNETGLFDVLEEGCSPAGLAAAGTCGDF